MLHQIGVGALGPVFRTYEPTRDRLVAVKVFRLDIVPEQAHALADELNRASEAGLFHPSIVEPIAAGVEGTVAYRAEEYVAAESLDVAMRHYAPASIDTALPFVTQLAGAIDFARAAGVGHGGLHPRDIFVTPDDARATGFGVVESLERVGIRAPVRRPYSAPERIAGEAWDIAADIFALAAIAFELLTGRRPAGTGGQLGTVSGPHVGDRAAALFAVLARAMDEDPEQRYPTALAFAGALESAARGQPVHESSPAPASATIAPPLTAAVVAGIAAPHEDEAVEAVAAAPPPRPREQTLFDDDLPAQAGSHESRNSTSPNSSSPNSSSPNSSSWLPPSGGRSTSGGRSSDTPVAEAADHPREGERFADAFEEDTQPEQEQEADGDGRRPLEASYEVTPADVYVPEPPAESPERSRPATLPIAVTLVLGLLAGFAAGYFVGSRDRGVVPGSTPTASTPAAPAQQTARSGQQWSEQAVTPPAATNPGTPGASASTPPPIAPDTARETPPAAREKGTPPSRPLATKGRLVVQSTPSRAGVTVNGKWAGRTPLTLDNLAFGPYVVRVVQPGYQVERQQVALTARTAAHTMSVRLQRQGTPASSTRTEPKAGAPPVAGAPAGFTGSLFVDSRPQGARVLFDGRNVGKTPMMLSDVRVGTHVVRIELDEHRPWSSTTTVTAGRESRVTGSLERFR